MLAIEDKRFEYKDRIFRVDRAYFSTGGQLYSMSAECLTPKKSDKSKWWSIEVGDYEFDFHTVQ